MRKDVGILVVDDEPGIVTVILDVLKGEGYQNLFTASDGLEALQVLAKEKDGIHVVVLDQWMPNLSGSATLEHMIQVHPFIVGVVFISGHINIAEYEKVAAKNRSDRIVTLQFLEKPLGFDRFTKAIEDAVSFVLEKRRMNQNVQLATFENDLRTIKEQVLEIRNYVSQQHGPGKFLKDIGVDIIRIILIGIAVVLLLHFGIEGFLRKLLNI